MFSFSRRSKRKMRGVHMDLVRVAQRALEITEVDFGITCGLRTTAEQRHLVAMGKSQTMRSRHLTGHAVDVVAYVDGKVSWEILPYRKIAVAFKQAAKELKINVEWGGDWRTFFDGPHFQLSRKDYP